MDVIMDWGLALCLTFVTTLEVPNKLNKKLQIDLIFWVSFHIMKIGLGSSLGFMWKQIMKFKICVFPSHNPLINVKCKIKLLKNDSNTNYVQWLHTMWIPNVISLLLCFWKRNWVWVILLWTYLNVYYWMGLIQFLHLHFYSLSCVFFFSFMKFTCVEHF